MFEINKFPTDIPGLKYEPSLVDYDNNIEFIEDYFLKIAQKTEPINYFSFKNRQLLFNCMRELKLYAPGYPPTRTGGILEIGIGKKERFLNTSTFILTTYKDYQQDYLGIDKENKDWLRGINGRIMLYEAESEAVLESFKNFFKHKPFVLLHIDGGHSIENILIDWQFSKFVRDNGIILLHDIKSHPGPITLVDAIDTDIYTVCKFFLEDEKDFGMAVVYKKENNYDTICR